MAWKPWLGAVPDAGGTHFRVWAPNAQSLGIRLAHGPSLPLSRDGEGYFTGRAEGVRAGARYFYRFPDGRERPDPASLLQPEGVHGPSEVVDLSSIAPRSPRPRVPLQKLVFCEIHLGTYTQEGTADAAARHLPELAEALYTAVEVMPVAAFPGARNWGYDGVAPFAAHAAYGGPLALARFVDAAHAQGLAAFLDVVYNHLGPEGNYLGEYGPYFTSRHTTPWGDALDFSLAPVRRYFVENALRWVSRAGGGFDGLRLDAVHGILDDSPRHILQEIADAVHGEGGLAIAESDLNDAGLIERDHLDASWADDLHHAIHVALTGESQGYYADFQDPMPKMAAAIERGWFYEGQHKPSFGRKHGTPAAHLRARHFVACAQNHDQIGNRARGERLAALTDEGGLRAAAAVVALQPALPLYFQGEEWGAKEPFLYFVSHSDPALAEAVRKGRREEFKAFSWAGEVPDPLAEETFRKSRIDRARKDAAALRWHKALLTLRREHPALQDDSRTAVRASAQGRLLLLRRGSVLLAASFDPHPGEAKLPQGRWRTLLDSGAADLRGDLLRMRGRGAVVLEQP
ncbi:MAG TPA: malto-oligosyltrehalose trehalohydrolase [Myxococcales bacterium]|nr:malto-oligosyltrehalose trehalohydrolase [Myxococcales bacterium]